MSSHEPASDASKCPFSLSDEVLLQICRASVVDAETKPGWLEELRAVPRLIGQTLQESHLELAVTMLASVLGELPRHNPVHLPFGFGGPRYQPQHWIDHDTLDRIGKQIMGLVRHDREPNAVAFDVEYAISESIRLGFLEQKHYDAWLPGMPSGSGWRTAVMATPYGIAKARAMITSLAETAARYAGSDPCGSRPGQTPVKPASDDGQAAVATEVLDEAPAATPPGGPDENQNQAGAPAVDDRYTWARQTELVAAVNQVLGQNMLNKGVVSRACQAKRLETNGRPGRASRVSVTSFLAWVTRHFSIGRDEQIQIRNAVIGEINARNP